MSLFSFFNVFILLLLNTKSLIIHHHVNKKGVQPGSYQTFSGVAMYAREDAPAKGSPGNVSFTRELTSEASSIELVLIPDTNIDDIGIHTGQNNELHICCSEDLIAAQKCDEENKDKLIVKRGIKGYYSVDIKFEEGQSEAHILDTKDVQITKIHVFAMASCKQGLGEVKFQGKSIWMNPYGHLPGDVYGYLPFYGWMCVLYLGIAVIWFCFNAVYWKQLLYVQNCITGVLALCLIEMGTWYFDYLHLNTKGIRHHGPFVLGLVTTVSRRMLSRMLVVAVSLGYGIVKPQLGPVKNKLIALGCLYWVFAFMFETLIHYNQTEKVETWMRVILIPPVAILNGIFWWWTFVALNRTTESLKLRNQSAKLQLYKSFTCVLIVALISAIVFALYEMYYALKELYFAEWERLWFMEVGFWQLLFSVIFIAIMVLWRPSEHSKTYAYAIQIGQEDDENGFGQPETFGDSDSDSDSDTNKLIGNNNNNIKQPNFTIGDNDDDSDSNSSHSDNNNNNNNKNETVVELVTTKID